MNAMWHVRGVDQAGAPVYKFLMSPDLCDPRKARRRAADEAKRRWLKRGVRVRIITVNCVG